MWSCSVCVLLSWLVCVVVCHRLPPTTAPSHYTLHLSLDPDPSHPTFPGTVHIKGGALSATREVVLHAWGINVTAASVQREGRELYSGHSMASDDTHFLNISLSEELLPGDQFTLSIDYSAQYYTYQSGVFRKSYETGSGDKRYLLATQMEATSARAAFPCYDEPHLKATFEIHITCPSQYFVLSNAPLKSTEELSEESRRHSFQSSPLMPSYLVAFVVSDFQFMSNAQDDVEQYIYYKEMRSYVRPDRRRDMGYSLDFGQRVLSFLENYTTVAYEMDKMDNVGVPGFGGAMENWGLVIYGEYYLAERRNSKGEIVNKETIASIVAHEFAHMWFGNEVTPLWWDNVWLSEGFATFFQFYGTSMVEQSWNYMSYFVTSNMHYSLRYDCYKRFKAMSAAASSPREISGKFNLVSYSKAGSVIRMMQHVLGEDTFRDSLQKYQRSIPKGSTRPQLLYDAMQSCAEGSQETVLPEGRGVEEVMGSWVDQGGYPLINITRRGDSDEFTVQQRRYYHNSSLRSDELWWVPLNWETESSLDFSSTSPQHWLPRTPSYSLTIPDSQPYFVLNKQQTGYYRVMYDEANWRALHRVLKEEPHQIHELNRAQIIDDSMEFSDAGIMPYNTSMRILSYISRETHRAPWAAAERALMRLRPRMRTSPQYHTYQKLVRDLNAPRLRMLTQQSRERDDFNTLENRRGALELACSFGDRNCLTSKGVSSELSESVLCYRLRKTGITELPLLWAQLWGDFSKSRDVEIRRKMAAALGCVRSTTLLNKVLQAALSDVIGKSEVSPLLIGVISSTAQGPGIVLDFLLKHLNVFINRVADDRSLEDAFVTLGEHITTERDLYKVERLMKLYGELVTGREYEALGQMVEAARGGVRWMREERPHLDQWLKENVAL